MHRNWSRHNADNSRVIPTKLNIETELPALDALCIQDGVSRCEMLRWLVMAEQDRRDRKVEE